MKDQVEVEGLSQAIANEREERIQQLEEQLSQAEKNATNNKAAADILNDMLQKGEVKQEDDGSVTVMRGPNYIGNADDIEK